ncbi:MAG: NTP transferase domain-containing protein [Candidatus Cloacimonetes bacterium]|nr:NTP transferase domain-containing protein [Candidatus Cloacimonadota bacterium]MDD2210326.1 NTP transferase domain-containing protein [Candidatus Cloacimonadota bacterium]MDD4686912.1 NTP transferase domain-containing protein [Candidatus Cloacimonadota bacterium]MDY0298961.1 NTP transferase domain-containing protein [Candidatus Cloacimonadaceae bacterium]
MPKSEAKVDGLLFSQRISRNLLDSGLHNIILAKSLDTPSMLDSLRKTLKNMTDIPSHLIIWPVDHPFVQSNTVQILVEYAMQNPDCIIKPEYRGRRGHPIIIPSDLDIHNPVYETLREVLRHSGVGTMIVAVEDQGILQNINTKDDLDRFLESGEIHG